MNKNNRQSGAVNGLLIVVIILSVLVVGLFSFAAWSFVNYSDQKQNVDAKIDEAVADAKRAQKEVDEKAFIEREKEPNRTFTAPSDFGSASIKYPKTWSVYVGENNRDYEVYFHPMVVPVVSKDQPFAARMSIVSRDYDAVLSSYQTAVKRGDLKSRPIEINSQKGNRLDGTFNEGIIGSMVIFKVRDKTLMLQTQSKDFMNDFEKTILKSLKFNP